MSIAEEHVWNERRSIVTWHDASFLPPRALITQVSGICFTDDGLVVLVSVNGEDWSLPGGRTEEGETVQETLIREVREEACASVVSLAYLGAQEVRDLGDSEGSMTYYQTRFWARVRLNEFKPEYEIKERKLVPPSEINLSLRWHPSGILEAMMETALANEKRHAANQE